MGIGLGTLDPAQGIPSYERGVDGDSSGVKRDQHESYARRE
jgi:hypothetical protein